MSRAPEAAAEVRSSNETQERPAAVLLVDDNKMLLDVVRACLALEPSTSVVGTAASAEEGIAAAEALAPDVVIMDQRLSGRLSGIDATREIFRRAPRCRVLGMSAAIDEQLLVEWFRAGSAGYICKGDALSEIVTAISTVRQGAYYLSPSVAGYIDVNRLIAGLTAGGRTAAVPRGHAGGRVPSAPSADAAVAS